MFRTTSETVLNGFVINESLLNGFREFLNGFAKVSEQFQKRFRNVFVEGHHSISAPVRGQKNKTRKDFNTPYEGRLSNDLMFMD